MEKCCKSAVGASILNCNFVDIKNEVQTLVNAGVDFVHLDVMDGNFVPDLTFGASLVKSLIASFPNVSFEVHMMVERPWNYVASMASTGVQRFIFHYETTRNARGAPGEKTVTEVIDMIKSQKMEPALAINPGTPAEVLFPYGSKVDAFLVMTVEPGLGGQKFMSDMLEKATILRSKFPNIEIELDGGVAPINTKLCGQAGASRAVVGTALLRSKQQSEDIVQMRKELFPIVE